MALQLRRGTDAERSAVTFADGELVYTTDTKKLYVGDGATAGGNSASADTLDSLTDTNLTGSTNNDVLTYNASTSKWESVSVPGLGRIALTDLTDVYAGPFYTGEILQFNGVQFAPTSINQIINPGSSLNLNLIADDSTMMVNATTSTFTGDLTGNVTGNAFGAHTGTLDGDLTGSVFGDDSSIIVDGINNTVVGNINNALVLTEQVTVNSSSASGTVISSNVVTAGVNGPNLDFFGSRVSLDSPIVLEPGDSVIDIAVNGWDGAAQTTAAVIKMGPDKYTGSIASGVMPGRIVFLTYNESGATGINNALVFNRFGNLGIGTDAPAEKLDVQGNIVASGTIQPGVYADATARDTALTAPTAGQMVYITDIAKFQGNTDGTITGWANLN